MKESIMKNFFLLFFFGGFWSCEQYNKQIEIESPNADQIWLSDMNADTVLNILDIIALVNTILNAEYNANGDMNQDGFNNVVDIPVKSEKGRVGSPYVN